MKHRSLWAAYARLNAHNATKSLCRILTGSDAFWKARKKRLERALRKALASHPGHEPYGA